MDKNLGFALMWFLSDFQTLCMGLKMGLCFVENWLGVIKVEFMANISPWLLPPTHKAIINFTTPYNYMYSSLQFVELKGSVFKKFDKNNLFQVSCSDVRERFHLFALLFLVVVQTMKEYGWREGKLAAFLIPTIGQKSSIYAKNHFS